MISPNQFQYPSRQYYCPTCRGNRIVWHPEITNCVCPACKGKGYRTDEDMTPRDYVEVKKAQDNQQPGRVINSSDFPQQVKRRGRPPKR